jgi:hypothetical protein
MLFCKFLGLFGAYLSFLFEVAFGTNQDDLRVFPNCLGQFVYPVSYVNSGVLTDSKESLELILKEIIAPLLLR